MPHFLGKLSLGIFFFLFPFCKPCRISKLNYGAICCVFDVVNMKAWKIIQTAGGKSDQG